MICYALGRLAQAAVIVGLITITVFLTVRLSAGDPARIRSPVFARPDVIEQYRREFGTDRPIIDQLASFLIRAAQGDLGESFRFQEPVMALVARALPNTLMLGATALALSLCVAVILGSLAALRPNSFWAWASSALAAFGQAAPVFWFGALLVLLFSIELRWLPAGGFTGPASLVLPAVAVSLSILPTQLRVLRAAMESALAEDFIRTARAFGIRERRIVFVYALRSASLALVTVIGVDVGYLFGGVIVAEVVFNFPGVGELSLIALNARDYPLIQGVTIVTACAFVLVNLAIDLLYVLIDPRIRLGQT